MDINALRDTGSFSWPVAGGREGKNSVNVARDETGPRKPEKHEDADPGKQEKTAAAPLARTLSGKELTPREMAVLLELQRSDRRVRQHEMAHIAAGGQYVRGGVHYNYRIGPDGRSYAVSGDVSIDASEESSPEATINKMRVVERAALAPPDPSPQDRAVAAKASQTIQKAEMELIKLQYEKNMSKSLDKVV